MNIPLISVTCVTYNHEKYVKDAIEGFLMQKTNFPIEIIIHDDASTDSTPDIIAEYTRKCPMLIKPIYQVENQYSKRIDPLSNFVWPKCSGKYIALCEGDDYWTDPYKLQKQVDFMEANEDYSLCFTNALVLDLNGKFIRNGCSETMSERTYLHVDMPQTIPTQTMLFRSKYIRDIPESFGRAPGGDTYLQIWLSRCGKIKYHNYFSAVYRITDQGVWNSQNYFQKRCHGVKTHLAILDMVKQELQEKIFHCLVGHLAAARKAANTHPEKVICEKLYRDLLNYFREERKLRHIDFFDYYTRTLSVIMHYLGFGTLLAIVGRLGIKKVCARIILKKIIGNA